MRNQGIMLTIGISLLVFGIIVWYISGVFIPGKERQIQNDYNAKYAPVKVLMVDGDTGIYSNTAISEDFFTQKTIIEVDVPSMFLPKDKNGSILVYTAAEKDSLMGVRTKRKLVKGEFLVRQSFDNTSYPDSEQFKRRKEYVLKNNVAGEIKTGSLIDVVVNYLNGDYDVVISKIKVERVVEAADQQAPAKSAEMTVILAVDETQFRDIELAKKLGSMEARLYDDEEQLSSLETFKYAEMKNLITTLARAKSLTGEIANYGSSTFIGFLGDKTDISEKLKARLAYYKEQLELNKLINAQQTTQTTQQPVVQQQTAQQPVVNQQTPVTTAPVTPTVPVQ